MMTRSGMAGLMAVISVALLGLPTPTFGATQETPAFWESPQFGFGVSWQEPWVPEADVSVEGEYDMLRLVAADAPLVYEFYGITWTEHEVGTPEEQAAYRQWAAIAYGDPTWGQRNLGNERIYPISGRMWTPNEITALPDQQRIALADTYIEEQGQMAALASFRAQYTDPGIISTWFVAEFRADVGDLVVVQEWAPEGARGQPLTIEYTAADGTRLTEWIHASSLGSGEWVYVFAASRPGDYVETEHLRWLDSRVDLSLPDALADGSAPTPVPTLPPRASHDTLAFSLATTPFLPHELPPLPPNQSATLVTGWVGNPLFASGPDRVLFSIEFQGRHADQFAGIAYWVHPDAEAARMERDALIAELERSGVPLIVGGNYRPGPYFGYDSVRLRLGTVTAYYVVVDHVVVVALVNHATLADAYAYDLAEAAIAHLLLVKTRL